MYGYEDVTPSYMLDLHCKALIGIQSGVVALPQFKTLKLALQLEGTDLLHYDVLVRRTVGAWGGLRGGSPESEIFVKNAPKTPESRPYRVCPKLKVANAYPGYRSQITD
jgi:hypothetical protein